MAKYSFASTMLRKAIKELGIVLTEQDIRRLIPVIKECLNEAEVKRELRRLTGLFATDPGKILDTRGVGKKTFVSIINVSKEFEGQLARTDTTASSDIDAAVASIRLLKRRTGTAYEAKISKVLDLLSGIHVDIVNKSLNTDSCKKSRK